MRWPSLAKASRLLAGLAALSLPVAADDSRMLRSTSLNTCSENSGYSASRFNVTFTPANHQAHIDLSAISSIEGHVLFDVAIYAYGYPVIRKTINPCDIDLTGLCPMVAGKMDNPFNINVPDSAMAQIPGIAYTMPDLDAKVRVFINMTSGDQAGQNVACVEANISNGKTVDLVGVKWAAALVAILALTSSAVISHLGHLNAASHIAVNTLSMIFYFQSQAMIGLCAIPLPPVVQAWTQDFQWSLGVIKVDFMQKIFTWYQRATGGTPSRIFDSLAKVSVQVAKRSLPAFDYAGGMTREAAVMTREVAGLAKRGNIQTSSGSYVVTGIQRTAFRAGIESTNVFMTVIIFFIIFMVLTALSVLAFKGLCEIAVKAKWVSSSNEQFADFRNGWRTILKGTLFRMAMIGYPGIAIFCLWELTQNDSAAEIILAIGFFFGISIALGWAAYKVIGIASRSIAMHSNPAYTLFSDPRVLNKWGFLYIPYRASGYYFVVPILGYILVKGIFLAFAQRAGFVQSIAFIIIEAAALITASVLRPWMDRSTNTFNIAICAINFVNSIFILMFTNVFDQPPLVTGIIGLALFVINAAFTLILLIMIIVTTSIIFFKDNPDARYQYMADDRTSFMKSQTNLTHTELDALAMTARGGKEGFMSGVDLDDDGDSIISNNNGMRRRPENLALPPSGSNSMRDPSHSPVTPSVPMLPSSGHGGSSSGSIGRPSADVQRAPSPYGRAPSNMSNGYRMQNNSSPMGYRPPGSPSPWQRGAGYDH